MEPNGVQLKTLFKALRQELKFQWRARYIEMLPNGLLAVSFEHSTNVKWRCLYVISVNGEQEKREYYV